MSVGQGFISVWVDCRVFKHNDEPHAIFIFKSKWIKHKLNNLHKQAKHKRLLKIHF